MVIKKNRIAKGLFLIIMIITSFNISSKNGKSTEYFVLDNGLQVYLRERHKIPLVNIVYGINVGSKDEDIKNSGIVHILEHLILTGSTETLSGEKIILQMRKRGLRSNAHTDHDFMTYEVSLPAQYIEFALSLVREKIFNLKLSKVELEKEKKVIGEEISQILDNPRRSGASLVLQSLFKNHPYEKPIYGNKKNVKSASTEQLETFYKRYFVPSNCAISVVGDFNIKEVKKNIQQAFGNLKKGTVPQPNFPEVSKLKKNIILKKQMDITNSYLILGFAAPPVNHKDQMIVNVLTKILGRGVNPLLGTILRQRKKLVDSINMQYVSLKYGGAILIYFTLDKKDIRAASRETMNFLKTTGKFRYSKKDFLPKDQTVVPDYLESTLNWMRFSFELYQERGMPMAVTYVRLMLSADTAKDQNYRKRLEEIKSSELRKVALKYLAGKKYVMIRIIPKNKK